MKKTGYYIFLIISALMLYIVLFVILIAFGLKAFGGWSLAMICGSIIIFIKPGLYQAYFNKKPENGNSDRPIAFILLVIGFLGMLFNFIIWSANEHVTQNLINGYY